MSKAANIAKVSARGSFQLLWGLVVSTAISSIGTIFIANLLGDTNFGLYTIALAAPNLISLFGSWGISGAMIRYTAQYKAENKTSEIRSIIVAGLLFQTILGVALSVVAFLLSGFLANLYSLPNLVPLIEIASFIILTGALFTTAQSVFTGMEKLELNSLTLVCQSIVRTVACPVLVLAGLGSLGAVIGTTVALLIASLLGVLLIWKLYKSLPKINNGKLEITASLKTMFNYGMPLSASNIINNIQTQFYGFILPIFVLPDIIGNYGIANTFVVLIGFFATPITTVLFPAFSKLDSQKDREALKNVFQFSIKYASLFVVPVAAIIMALSQPGISILFPQYSTAPLFLALLAITYLYTPFGTLSNANLINSQGQTRFLLKLTLINAALGFPLSIVLISQLGVIGLIITILTIGWPSRIIGLRWLKKQYGVAPDWASSAKILLSSATASAITYTVVSIAPFSNLIRLIIGSVVFIGVLIIVTLLSRTIDRTDVNNLRDMLAELGPFRRLFNFLLNIIEKLMTCLQP